MDKDDFDLKLRELKRQKSKVEEEYEDSQEKWRLERKRLNSDIDRLENALADAKEARKKSGDTKTRGIDPVEVAKIQATADERIKKAAADWDVERAKFKAEITRLEQSVTEILERANN